MLKLLLSLSGIGAGYLLGVIAPEEISSGRKYFMVLEKVILSILIVTTAYFLKKNGLTIMFLVISFLGIVLFLFFFFFS